MSALPKKRAEKARQRQPGSDQLQNPSEGMSMAVDSQYGGTPPKSKSEWQPIGQVAARIVAKAKEARDD